MFPIAVLLAALPLAPGGQVPVNDLDVIYRNGQVFITWTEDGSQTNESYRVYRDDRPITQANLSGAQLLYEVHEGSSTFWADRYFTCTSNPGSEPVDLIFKQPHLCAVGNWQPRFASQLVVEPWTAQDPTTHELSTNTGLLVWTLADEDLYGIKPPNYFYAVTTVSEGGIENTAMDLGNTARSFSVLPGGPESVRPPRPIKIAETHGDGLQYDPPLQDLFPVTRHVYIQYMDLREFNPTLVAPNQVENDYGLDLASLAPTHALRNQLQYAFPYVIVAPTNMDQLELDLGGLVDGQGNPIQTQPVPYPAAGLPVVLRLHAGSMEFKDRSFFESTTRLPTNLDYYVPPAIEIRAIDVGSTGWFGFAKSDYDPDSPTLPGIDYRDPSFAGPCDVIASIAEGATISNYTEQRVLRMVSDLWAAADNPADTTWFGHVDKQRTYVLGHSTGGNGTIALALRFPNVFAGAYAHAPATRFENVLEGFPLGTLTDNQQLMCELFQSLARKWGPPVDPGLFHAPCALYLPCMPAPYPTPFTPVEIHAPAELAEHLALLNASNDSTGVHVWDWQNHPAQLGDKRTLDMAPIGVRHSTGDEFILWPTQGSPFFDLINSSGQAWGGVVDDQKLSHLEFAWYNGLPPGIAERTSNLNKVFVPPLPLYPPQPFYGYTAITGETVPGITLQPSSVIPSQPQPEFWKTPAEPTEACYNARPTDYALAAHPGLADYPLYSCEGPTVEWNASWNLELTRDIQLAPFAGPDLPVDNDEAWSIVLRSDLPAAYPQDMPVFVDVTPRRREDFQIFPGNVYSYEVTEHELSNAPQKSILSLKVDNEGLLVIPDVPVTTDATRISLLAKFGVFEYGPDPAPPSHSLRLTAIAVGQIGGLLELEIAGLEAFPGVVTLGLGKVSFPIANAVLLLNPGLFTFVLPPAQPDLEGVGTTVLPIPADLTLIGKAIYFQATAVDLELPPYYLAFSNGLKVILSP